MTDRLDHFLDRLSRIPAGYSEGDFDARRYGVTHRSSADGKRAWLYGEELGGDNRISCNVYRIAGRTILKPCEMPEQKVIDFVLGFTPLA